MVLSVNSCSEYIAHKSMKVSQLNSMYTMYGNVHSVVEYNYNAIQ